jgi:hypothetical protein
MTITGEPVADAATIALLAAAGLSADARIVSKGALATPLARARQTTYDEASRGMHGRHSDQD